MTQLHKLYKEKTSLTTWLITFLFLVLGIACLFFTSFNSFKDFWNTHETWRQIIYSLGFFFLAPVAIGLLWQLFIRRTFIDEIVSRVRIAEEIRSAGIVGYVDDFNKEIDWDSFFKNSSKIDILFAYGSTWRKMNEKNFRDFISRGGVIRVVVPNPENSSLVSELAKRFFYTNTQLKEKINEAISFFNNLKSVKKNAEIHIWALDIPLVFSFYRFDNTAILPYSRHGQGRGVVPTLYVQNGGKLYNFVCEQFDEMIKENGLAKRLN